MSFQSNTVSDSEAHATFGAETTADSLIRQAKEGNKDALVALVLRVQQRVYTLAIRMLGHPADAEDATQDILMRIVNHLGSFREECAFDTWAYRVACNHLMTWQRRHGKRNEVCLDQCDEMIEREMAAQWPASTPPAEQAFIVDETMRHCIQALLLSLNRSLRMTFILGEIFEVPGAEAAQALGLTPIAFRKQLSRARILLRSFMRGTCGLVNDGNPCHCKKQAAQILNGAGSNVERLHNGIRHPPPTPKAGTSFDRLLALDELQRVAAVFRSLPDRAVPDMPRRVFEQLIESVEQWLLHSKEKHELIGET